MLCVVYIICVIDIVFSECIINVVYVLYIVYVVYIVYIVFLVGFLIEFKCLIFIFFKDLNEGVFIFIKFVLYNY